MKRANELRLKSDLNKQTNERTIYFNERENTDIEANCSFAFICAYFLQFRSELEQTIFIIFFIQYVA